MLKMILFIQVLIVIVKFKIYLAFDGQSENMATNDDQIIESETPTDPGQNVENNNEESAPPSSCLNRIHIVKKEYLESLNHFKDLNISKEALDKINHTGNTWGDIILNEEQCQYMENSTVLMKRAKGRTAALDFVRYPNYKWDISQPIPVIFTTSNKNMYSWFQQAIQQIQKVSCIRFNLVQSTNAQYYMNIREVAGNCGGSSSVGRQRGGNTVSVQTCTSAKPAVGTTMHEIFHALGYHHTQVRGDATSYLSFNWNNINPSNLYNFVPTDNSISLNQVPFDYNSIMIYYWNAFAINPSQGTITPLVNAQQNMRTMGMLYTLSQTDIAALNYDYCGVKTQRVQIPCKDDNPTYCKNPSQCGRDIKMNALCRKTCRMCT